MMLYVAWRMISMPQVDDESAAVEEPTKTAVKTASPTGRWGR
jgi:hypothetical protein